MPILESKTDHAAVRRILLATSLGAIFGLQSCKLLEFGLAPSVPLRTLAWNFLSYLMAGCTIGLTAGCTSWWKRGWLAGLLFSIPIALDAHAVGLRSVPYGVAVLVAGSVSGILVAFLTDSLMPFSARLLRPPSVAGQPYTRQSNIDALRRRLSEEKACLEDLDAERQRRGDWDFGRTVENRVIWGQLLDLELQEIDEQLSRIRNAAGTEDPPANIDRHSKRKAS